MNEINALWNNIIFLDLSVLTENIKDYLQDQESYGIKQFELYIFEIYSKSKDSINFILVLSRLNISRFC